MPALGRKPVVALVRCRRRKFAETGLRQAKPEAETACLSKQIPANSSLENIASTLGYRRFARVVDAECAIQHRLRQLALAHDDLVGAVRLEMGNFFIRMRPSDNA